VSRIHLTRTCSSQVRRAFDDEAALAGDRHLLARGLAPEVAATPREVAAVQGPQSQALAPVWYYDTVRGPADRVFRQAGIGGEDADDDVAIRPSWRGRDHRAAAEGGDLGEVRAQAGDGLGIRKDSDIAERRDQTFR
jgi:hypothetical protein